MQPANIPFEVFLFCTAKGDGFDWSAYEALATTVSYGEMFDVLEGQEVHASWMAAATLNAGEGDQ